MRKILTILFLFILGNAFGKTIVVGKNKGVSTIKQAIKIATNGDTILLSKGIYKEGNVIIDKSICLLGLDGPVLDGEFKNEILTLSGKNIVVRGIHFANAGYSSMNDFAAIKVIDATNILIENNQINNASFAIHIANSTPAPLLRKIFSR